MRGCYRVSAVDSAKWYCSLKSSWLNTNNSVLHNTETVSLRIKHQRMHFDYPFYLIRPFDVWCNASPFLPVHRSPLLMKCKQCNVMQQQQWRQPNTETCGAIWIVPLFNSTVQCRLATGYHKSFYWEIQTLNKQQINRIESCVAMAVIKWINFHLVSLMMIKSSGKDIFLWSFRQ